jgi:hypothetical protein
VTFLPLDQKPMLLLAMVMPTVTTLLMLLVVTRDGYSRAGWPSLGLHRLGIKAWPLAVLVPLAVIGIASGVVWSMGVAAFNPHLRMSTPRACRTIATAAHRRSSFPDRFGARTSAATTASARQ